MLNVSQAASSPAVSLVYAVKNGTVFLNGTAASNLLCQLSAELVGYFLFYPPLVIAERKLHIAYLISKSCRRLHELIFIRYTTGGYTSVILDRLSPETYSQISSFVQFWTRVLFIYENS